MERFQFKVAFAVDDIGTVTGLASVFGTRDRGGDVVHKGAFADARAPLPMLASHDPADVVGVWDELNETPEGLLVKGRLLVDDVARAKEVRALIQGGAMSGLSIGYIARKSAPRQGGGRDLHRVELLEISVVAVPMHPGARITSAKSATEKERENMDPEELIKQMETKAADVVAGAVAEAVKPITERLDKIEAKANRGGAGGETQQEPTAERKAFAAYLQRGPLAPESETKFLTVSSDPNGGYLAPPEMATEIIRDLVEFSPIRSVASVRGTTAPSVIYPTRKPMGNATWDDELSDEVETSTTDIFGTKEVAVKGMSTFVDISNQLMQDAPQAETEVRLALAEDFAKKESVAFVKGDGIIQPEGLMTHAGIEFTKNGHAANLSADALITLMYALPATYRNRGVWAMNGNTLAAVRKLKDGQQNYLWQPSYQAGQPETILGRPVVEVLDMDDIGADKFPIIYGDMQGYRILDRLSMSMLVDPYSQATRKVTRIHATRRVGGRVLYPAYFRKLKMAV